MQRSASEAPPKKGADHFQKQQPDFLKLSLLLEGGRPGPTSYGQTGCPTRFPSMKVQGLGFKGLRVLGFRV